MLTYFVSKLWNATILTNKDSDGQCKLSVQDDFTRLSMDVLGECILGYKFNSIEDKNNEIAEAIFDVATSTDANIGDKMLRQLMYYLPFTKEALHLNEANKIASKAIKQVKRIIISARRLLRLQSLQ